MKNHRRLNLIVLLLLVMTGSFAQNQYNTTKPWTYWWWMGSAVNEQDIKIQLEEFSAAGLGGVHIIPIYGVKGYENQFIPFLSEKWLERIQFTIRQAGKLNLGVDMTLGTGWPFGGSWVGSQHAAKRLAIRYDPSDPDWKMKSLTAVNTGQKVKRAAPGGEGPVIDYFDVTAIQDYLNHFDSVLSKTAFPIQPRAWYHDSYEAYQANWSNRFPVRFKELAGYDLTDVMPVFTDSLNPLRPLIVHDFRETLADLLYTEFAGNWTRWCGNHGTATRYQAHGSPGNLLDLYALADIPETESFGCSNFPIPGLTCDPDYEEASFGRPSPLMMKFASSAAHLTNKQLVSSESGTWLANHFKVSLSRIKPQIDELFVSGINHVFYHGTTYSPKNENYPGWLFYASTNFGPTSHFWNELPLLNNYVRECQTILQNSTPDNDILLYFPIDELWTKYPGDLLLLLDVHKYTRWFGATEFGQTSKLLWDNGFTFDYISDRQISQLTLNPEGKLSVNAGSTYSVIVVPSIDYINKSTLKKLELLAKAGAKIFFADRLPEHFAGYLARKQPLNEIIDLKAELSANTIISADLLEYLEKLNIRQEEIKLKGLDFIRKRTGSGTVYFITNLNDRFYQDTIVLSEKSKYIELFDPQSLRKGYVESLKPFYLQLPPGKSCFIQLVQEKPTIELWQFSSGRDTMYLDSGWTVSFISGNNQNLQPAYKINNLTSWTGWGDEHLKSFCGKARYTSDFTIKNFDSSRSYRLVFDEIRETAQIKINGIPCGTIWALPYSIEIPPSVLKKKNRIEITVQNVSANYIRQVDQQKIPWKKFHDINFVDIRYKPFDAANWEDIPSGLIGRVLLIRNE